MLASFPSGLALLIALCGTAAADQPSQLGVAVENIAEAMTSMIVLPASINGTLSFHLCATCKTVTLTATPTTSYIINHRSVPLAAVAKLFATGNYTAAVAWELNKPVLRRLEIVAPPAAASRSTSP